MIASENYRDAALLRGRNLDQLLSDIGDFAIAEDLPTRNADKLLNGGLVLTMHQRQWLIAFQEAWTEAEDAEDVQRCDQCGEVLPLAGYCLSCERAHARGDSEL